MNPIHIIAMVCTIGPLESAACVESTARAVVVADVGDVGQSCATLALPLLTNAGIMVFPGETIQIKCGDSEEAHMAFSPLRK